jgi:hypothetical protein
MDLGLYQLPIFFGLVMMLGAAFVALICILLKGSNEQLRELVMELRVRREEDHRRWQMMTAPPAPARAETIDNRAETSAPRAKPAGPARKRTASTDAIAAMARGAALAGALRSKPSADYDPQERRPEALIATPEPAASVALGVRQGAACKKDWNSLLNRRAEEKPPVEVRQDLIEAAAVATVNATEFPAGFQDAFVLSQLMQSHKPVTGLVVSIGVNAPHNANGSLPEPVRGLIQSLVGPGDFAWQSSAEEFLLICPGECGASAQRRLSRIAQQLWDFQLRSLGTFSILFNWGGVEVRSESIDEAIASANERMQETRRARKFLAMGPRSEPVLRRAV